VFRNQFLDRLIDAGLRLRRQRKAVQRKLAQPVSFELRLGGWDLSSETGSREK